MENSMRRHSLAVTELLVAALLLFLPPQLSAEEFCPPKCPSGTMTLGFAGPLTGASAAFGLQTSKSVQVGVDKLNAVGGVLGVPVKLSSGDDRCDRGQSVDVANRHVLNEKLTFVIGPACPAAALTASQIYAKAGVVQFAPTATTVDLTRQGLDSVFRMLATVEQEAQELGRYFAREYPGKKLTVVYVDNFYGRSIANNIRQAVPPKSLGQFEPLLHMPGAYDRLVDKLQRNPPDAIYIALQDGTSVEFLQALSQRNLKPVILGGQQLLSQSFWFQARELAEGIRVLAPISSVTDPGFKAAVDQLNAAKIIPDLVALSSLAAVQTWAEAVRRAGSGDPKAVIQVLHAGEFHTAIGPVAFDERGDRRDIRYTVLTWRNERLSP